MTLSEHLQLPIEERIKRYTHEFIWGNPEGVQHGSGRGYKESELNDYILYRLKREEFERKEVERATP